MTEVEITVPKTVSSIKDLNPTCVRDNLGVQSYNVGVGADGEW